MFEAFETRADVAKAKRLALSGAVSVMLFAGGGVGLAWLAAQGATVVKKQQVDVSFRKPPPVAKIEPAPLPPPPVVKPRPKPVVAEVVAPKPAPAPAPIVVPREVPKEKPPEADAANPVGALAMAVGGTGDGTAEAVEEGEGEESAAPVVASAGYGPVNLPEDADPPEPFEENAQPEYPEAARASGEEHQVVLKIVVLMDGTVGAIKVMRGGDPFLTEALEKVKTWRYEPARLEGEPITVFKIVNIKFRLRS